MGKRTKYEKLQEQSQRDRDLIVALQTLEWALRRLKVIEGQLSGFISESSTLETSSWRRGGENLLADYGIELRGVDGGYT